LTAFADFSAENKENIMVSREVNAPMFKRRDSFLVAILATTTQYKSNIYFEISHRENAKSLVGLKNLNIVSGYPVKIIADGEDENEALEAVVSKFLSAEY
jgi:phosphotransferase system HPr-like phosphotransfer protein